MLHFAFTNEYYNKLELRSNLIRSIPYSNKINDCTIVQCTAM